MYSIYIIRKYLEPDIKIYSNDLGLLKFISKLYHPLAYIQQAKNSDAPNQSTYLIKAISSEKSGFSVEYDNTKTETGIDDVVQLIENIIYSITYPASSIIPLHGAAVTYGRSSFIFAGGTTSGKSTLCAYLTANGFGYITDD